MSDAATYAIPVDNPFASDGDPDTRDEIWAFGLRNPWRISFDRLTGDFFVSDVGQEAREEINFQSSTSIGGENYGWRRMEGSLCDTCTNACNDGTMILPIIEYGRSTGDITVIGGYRYRGSQIPPLNASYIFGDYGSGRIWNATVNDNGTWTTNELLNIDPNFILSTFGEDERGELYVGTVQGGQSRVHRIVASDTDDDSLPDWWERAYFGTPTIAAATQDADGDGYTNLQEYQTGTSPQDSTSSLRIISVTRAANDVSIQFTSVDEKRYRIDGATTLKPSTWVVLTNAVAGTGGILSMTDFNNASQSNRFYRVVLVP